MPRIPAPPERAWRIESVTSFVNVQAMFSLLAEPVARSRGAATGAMRCNNQIRALEQVIGILVASAKLWSTAQKFEYPGSMRLSA